MHNLNIEYIIPELGNCFLFKIIIIFLTYTHSHHSKQGFSKKKKKKHHSKQVDLCFNNIYKYATIFVFIENENAESYFHFLYSNLIFKMPKMKIKYKY